MVINFNNNKIISLKVNIWIFLDEFFLPHPISGQKVKGQGQKLKIQLVVKAMIIDL
jgi:hypothetical protein